MSYLVFVCCFGEKWNRDGMPEVYQRNLLLSAKKNHNHKFVILKDFHDRLKLISELEALDNISEQYCYESENSKGLLDAIYSHRDWIDQNPEMGNRVIQYIRSVLSNIFTQPTESSGDSLPTLAHKKDFVQFIVLLAVNCLTKIYHADDGVVFIDLDHVFISNLDEGKFCPDTGLQWPILKISDGKETTVLADSHHGFAITPNAKCLDSLHAYIDRILCRFSLSAFLLPPTCWDALMPEHLILLKYNKFNNKTRDNCLVCDGNLSDKSYGLSIKMEGSWEDINGPENMIETTSIDLEQTCSFCLCNGFVIANMHNYTDWNSNSGHLRLHGLRIYDLFQISLGNLMQYSALTKRRTSLKTDEDISQWRDIQLKYVKYLGSLSKQLTSTEESVFSDCGTEGFVAYQKYISNLTDEDRAQLNTLTAEAEQVLLSENAQSCDFVKIKMEKLQDQDIKLYSRSKKQPVLCNLVNQHDTIYKPFYWSDDVHFDINILDQQGNAYNLPFLLSVTYDLDQGFDKYNEICQALSAGMQVKPNAIAYKAVATFTHNHSTLTNPVSCHIL